MTDKATGRHARGRPRRELGRQTGRDILQAAALLAAAGGLTMRAVSRRAEVQPGTIYAHYASKSGLLNAVLGSVGPGVVVRLCAGLRSPADLPAFCAAVAAAWASPLARLAFRAYRLRGTLPSGGRLDALPDDLRPEVQRAMHALERQLAHWPCPLRQQGLSRRELAWQIMEPLLALRESELTELEQVQRATRHGERLHDEWLRDERLEEGGWLGQL